MIKDSPIVEDTRRVRRVISEKFDTDVSIQTRKCWKWALKTGFLAPAEQYVYRKVIANRLHSSGVLCT